MKNSIKNFYKNNFVYSTKEKLSKITILFILALDIIVYFILIEGMNFQTSFVNQPNQKYSTSCSNIMYKNKSDLKSFNSNIYLDSFSIKSNYYYNKNGDRFSDDDLLDSRCKEIALKIIVVKKEINIKELNKKDKDLRAKASKLSSNLDYIKRTYDTVLFEKIANLNSDKSILEDEINSKNIKEKYDLIVKELDDIYKQRETLQESFENSSSVKELIAYIHSIKDFYLEDEKKAVKMYYYKIEIVTLLFLLPILLIFFYFMKKFIKDEKYILYVIFKNLLIVSLIPTLYTIFMVIYKFMPKVFISKIINFFYNLEVPFLFYYILIIIFVLFFVFIIIKIQKMFKKHNEKLKNNEIRKIKSYNQSLCNQCGNKVYYTTMNYCPCCKNVLQIECKSCKKSTINGLAFCQNCGGNLKE